jgi:hypothetical protein
MENGIEGFKFHNSLLKVDPGDPQVVFCQLPLFFQHGLLPERSIKTAFPFRLLTQDFIFGLQLGNLG